MVSVLLKCVTPGEKAGVKKTVGNPILFRMRQEETHRDSVRQLLTVGVLYLHR